MANKRKIITEAAQAKAKELSASVIKYAAFLETAANNYKYSFMDQLLIYMQKPEATACAEIDIWNRLGRWVNKGAKGIALLSDAKLKYQLRYVFDVSDTNSRAGHTVNIWKMEHADENSVRESLMDSFDMPDNASERFPVFLTELAGSLAEDNYSDYLTSLDEVIDGSKLDGMKKEVLTEYFKTTLKGSISYMLLTRCGYSPRQYVQVQAFDHIRLFSTPKTFAALGTDIYGNVQRLDNVLDGFTNNLNACQAQLENTKSQMETAKAQVQKPFPCEEEFQAKSARLAELNATLDMDKHENEIADSDTIEAPQAHAMEQTR